MSILKFKIGLVIKVFDGDTILVKYQDLDLVLRLAQIDAPEMSQPFGIESQKALSSLILNKKIYFYVLNKDHYGRFVSEVKINNRYVSRILLTKGLVWTYPLYVTDKNLFSVEKLARKKKVGLWSQTKPEAPWDYRKKQKS